MVRYFTLKKAQDTLPQIIKLVKKLININRSLNALFSIEIKYDQEDEELQNITRKNKEYHRLSYEFFTTLELVNDIGCILKDLENGIVDFYSKHEGRDVLLCWHLGEEKIEYWHDVSGGFVGRRQVNELINK